jgi:ferrous iron transport protein A
MNRLDQDPLGSGARVIEVQGSDDLAVRLMEMGLTPGIELRVLGTAPLGDPIEIQIRGYRLSVRKGEAARVAIEPL